MNTITLVPDTELIKTALQGNQDSYEQLYTRYKQRVKSALMLLTRHSDVDDLIQETFLAAFKNLKQFRGASSFPTWLHSIAVNVYFQSIRGNNKNYNEKIVSYDNLDKDDEEIATRFMATEDLNLKGCLDRITITKVLKHLPPGCRGLFIAHHIFGLSHREISKLFNHSIENSKSQVFRAKIKVRQVLTPRFKARSTNGMGNK